MNNTNNDHSLNHNLMNHMEHLSLKFDILFFLNPPNSFICYISEINYNSHPEVKGGCCCWRWVQVSYWCTGCGRVRSSFLLLLRRHWVTGSSAFEWSDECAVKRRARSLKHVFIPWRPVEIKWGKKMEAEGVIVEQVWAAEERESLLQKKYVWIACFQVLQTKCLCCAKFPSQWFQPKKVFH